MITKLETHISNYMSYVSRNCLFSITSNQLYVLLVLITVIIIYYGYSIRKYYALKYIKRYVFPVEIKEKLMAHYPQLADQQIDKVMEGLRVYFYLSRKYKLNMAMPSLVIDTAWHEFLLFSPDYMAFSKSAFGRYFHHVPTVARLKSPMDANTGLVNVWLASCEEENIDFRDPVFLPILFSLDAEYDIINGFIYSIKDGVLPLDIISPNRLMKEIKEKYLTDPTQLQIEKDRLATKLKRYLLDDNYCTTYGREALIPLFHKILEDRELTIAIFGSVALAKGRLSSIPWFASNYISYSSFGGGGGCGGGDGGGCGGGCGG
jgi:hypothetical protein